MSLKTKHKPPRHSAAGGHKLGFIGLRPKCKMQNAKCKIRKREKGSVEIDDSKYPLWTRNF